VFLEFFLLKGPFAGDRIYCDELSLIMVLIIDGVVMGLARLKDKTVSTVL
jgi:hypothetical protein